MFVYVLVCLKQGGSNHKNRCKQTLVICIQSLIDGLGSQN